MIVAVFFSASLCYLYYTIRTKVSQHKQAKINLLNEQKTRATQLLLVKEEEFDSFFTGKYDLSDNSPKGLNEEKLLQFLRINGLKNKIEIYSLNKMTDGSRDLLKLLNVPFVEHSLSEIIEKTVSIGIENIESKNESKFSKLKRNIFSVPFRKFAIKYGAILLIFSLFTPYKIYYLIFGAVLLLWGIFLLPIEKLRQKTT